VLCSSMWAALSWLCQYLVCISLAYERSSPSSLAASLVPACGLPSTQHQRTQVDTCSKKRTCSTVLLSVCYDVSVQVVLSAWQYHQGTQTGGVPTYHNSKVAAAYISSRYPTLPGE
jgi:hypothetical protein